MFATTNTAKLYTVTAPTKENLASDFAAILIDRGWTIVSLSAGVYRLSALSPQGYTVELEISSGSSIFDYLIMQFIGSSNGYPHLIEFGAAFTYQIIASRCAFFLSKPGVAVSPNGASICGGIPFMDDGCGQGTEPVTESWFSFGDCMYNPTLASACPRDGLDVAGGLSVSGSLCYNGTLYLPSLGTLMPRILVLTSVAVWDATPPDLIQYMDGTPLIYPAFVAAGPTNAQLRIFGQVYDAIVQSTPADMDTLTTIDGFNCMAYTHRFPYGTLWLMRDDGIIRQQSNYVH